MNRKVSIISILMIVGITSLVISIWTDPSVSAKQAILSLGVEGLKAALVFILVDYLIKDHDAQRLNSERAQIELMRTVGDIHSSINDYLDKISVKNVVTVDLNSNHSLFKVRLSKRQFADCVWSSVDFSQAQLDECELTNVEIINVSFKGTIFERVKFTNGRIAGTDLSRCLFVDCEFAAVTLRGNIYSDTRFKGCNFTKMAATSIPTVGTDFVNCTGIPSGNMR
jgi:uncharacterized protein YjbI with pentapeptide repeats